MADKAEKDLDQASDCGWVRALDANGNPIKIEKSVLVELIRANMPVAAIDKNGLMSYHIVDLLSHMEIRVAEIGGGGILAEGVGFCFGYDKDSPTSYCLFSFVRMPGMAAVIRDKISGSLTIGNQNEQGTSIINGATNYFSITLL